MEKKAKFKKPLIIIVAVIAICTAGYFLFTQNNSKPNNEPCENCTIDANDNNSTKLNKAKYFNLTFSGETKEYNAYDFIIEKMSQAQYWSYDEFHPAYHSILNRFYPSYEEPILNGTGWTLIDEDTAIFARGFESRLVINFSNNSAYNDPMYCELDYLADPYGKGLRYGNQGNTKSDFDWTLYDVKNEPYALRIDANEYIDFRKYYDFNNLTYKNKDTETSFDDSNNDCNLTIFYEIYNTLEFYNKIFAELDIPILNEPAGTLAKYKNKTIQVPVELIELTYLNRECDGKINSIFDERSGWQVHWEEDENVPWLEDYRDVLNQQFPKTQEDSYVVGKDGRKWAYYSPIFLYNANNDWYNKNTSYEEEPYKDDLKQADKSGAIMMYYIKPLYQQIFGFNGIYFIEHTKVENGLQADAGLTIDEFKSGNISMLYNDALALYNAGDILIGNSNTDYIMVDYIKELSKYYNVESPYGNDYINTFDYIYNTSGYQEKLGLR